MLERILQSRITECTAIRVVSTHRVTPHMLRVTFAGKNLEAFATNENLHVKLFIPPAGAPRKNWLSVRPDGKSDLHADDRERIVRRYTIRRIDASAGALDIDFVLHEDGGPGSNWAAQAQEGDLLGMIGPGGRGLATADWYLIAADETALPAVGRMLDTLPADAKGHILVEIADKAEEQPLNAPRGMSLRWLHRNGAPAGTTALLYEAVKAAPWAEGGGKIFAWVGAEFSAAQEIRRHLEKDRRLHKSEQLVVAYWRRDAALTE